jgi:hypothetical protein
MTRAPFHVGEEGDCGRGFRYRVRQGRKGPTDKILDVASDRGAYVPVSMELGFLLADFFRQNEDELYLPSLGLDGGDMYLNRVLCAARNGWRSEADRLRGEREARAARNRA